LTSAWLPPIGAWRCPRASARASVRASRAMPSPVEVAAQAVASRALRVAVLGLGGWAAWYMLVLKRAMKSTKPWGPRWLAVASSGALFRFGSWWLKYSDNCEESLKSGIWGPGKQYIFVWHPHGNFTIAALYFVSHWWAKNYPGGVRGDRYVCVAPLLLRIPFLAELLVLCHARSQDRQTFDALLATGATVAVQPGGLAEQVSTDETTERMFFPANLGFIRLALKHGVPLLPCYAFGENQLYHTPNWSRKLNGWLYRTLKCGSLVVQGQGGIPTSPVLPNPLMLPIFRSGMHIRIGEPVHLGPKEENPSEERVQQAFKLYLDGLHKVFNKYKDQCLPKEVAARGLVVEYRGRKVTDEIRARM